MDSDQQAREAIFMWNLIEKLVERYESTERANNSGQADPSSSLPSGGRFNKRASAAAIPLPGQQSPSAILSPASVDGGSPQ